MSLEGAVIATGTLADGFESLEWICLSDGCFELVVSSGTADSEISFEFQDEVRAFTCSSYIRMYTLQIFAHVPTHMRARALIETHSQSKPEEEELETDIVEKPRMHSRMHTVAKCSWRITHSHCLHDNKITLGGRSATFVRMCLLARLAVTSKT